MDFDAFKQKMLDKGLSQDEFEKFLYDFVFDEFKLDRLDAPTLELVDETTYESSRVKRGYDSKKKGFFGLGKNDVKIPLYYDLAYYLRDSQGCKCKDKYVWIFNGKNYEFYSYERLQNLIAYLTKDQANPTQLAGFYKIVLAKNQVDEELTQPEGLINLNNGVLDIKNKKLIPHSKDYFFKYKLPLDYDPQAKCPRFLKFLDETFYANVELAQLTFQIFGYCLIGGNPFLHKAFVLLGNGRNGKSAWLHALKGLMGKENYSSVSISLLNRPFSVVQMDGKLANIVGELTSAVIDSESFKTAVGGEELTAAHKNKDEFSLKIDSRMIFATNHLPVFKDTTAGMYEKLCILPFDRYLKPHERDPGIFDEITKELPGILNLALEGASQVIKDKCLINPQAVIDKLEEYREDSDQAYLWIKQNITVTNQEYDRLVTKEAYSKFIKDTAGENKNPLTLRGFGKRLHQYLRNHNDFKADINVKFSNGRNRGLTGLKMGNGHD